MPTNNSSKKLWTEAVRLVRLSLNWKYANWIIAVIGFGITGIMVSLGRYGLSMVFVTLSLLSTGILYWKSGFVRDRQEMPGRKRARLVPNRFRQYSGITVITIVWLVVIYAINAKRNEPNIQLQKGYIQVYNVLFSGNNKTILPGKRLGVNIYLKNEGTAPAENVYPVFEAALASIGPDPAKGDREMHSGFLANALKANADFLNSGKKGLTVSKGEGPWVTLFLPKESEPPLTQAQVDGILQGSYRLYVYAWARWRDAANDLDFCEWLQKPEAKEIDNEKLIWHLCADSGL